MNLQELVLHHAGTLHLRTWREKHTVRATPQDQSREGILGLMRLVQNLQQQGLQVRVRRLQGGQEIVVSRL